MTWFIEKYIDTTTLGGRKRRAEMLGTEGHQLQIFWYESMLDGCEEH